MVWGRGWSVGYWNLIGTRSVCCIIDVLCHVQYTCTCVLHVYTLCMYIGSVHDVHVDVHEWVLVY